jgi:hypothetical protein
MYMLLVIAKGCRRGFSRTITGFTPTYFFASSAAVGATKSALTGTALAFKKFNNVEDIHFFDHS